MRQREGRRPEGYWAERGGKRVFLLIEPFHPRFSASLSEAVKEELTEEQRLFLAEKLAPSFGEALKRWPDRPLLVGVNGRTYALSDNPNKPGKVLVRHWLARGWAQ